MLRLGEPSSDKIVQRKPVVLAWQHENEQYEGQPRDYVSVKLVQGFFQKMAECNITAMMNPRTPRANRIAQA